jgi:hypothetical protein
MATQPAILGAMRLGNVRLGYEPSALATTRRTKVRVTLAGLPVHVRRGSVTIHDELNDAPNTCALTVDEATPPTIGQALRVTINSDAPRLLFAGALETVDATYQDLTSQLLYPCTAQDDTPRANRRRPFGTWTTVSATTIALSLVADFAPGFTATHVQADLPPVSLDLDGSEGMNGALGQIAQLLGGYFYWEDGDLHLFLDEATDAPDALDGTPGRVFNTPPIAVVSDDSQIRTRVFGKGHGEQTLSDVAAGEPIVPITNAGAWFSATGGKAISDTQRLDYTGVQAGGGAALVGIGLSPASPPGLTLEPGLGLGVGTYSYGFSFGTSSGETTLSPLAAVTTRSIATPADAPATFASVDPTGYGRTGWTFGDTVTIKVSYGADATHTHDTAVGPASAPYTILQSAAHPGSMQTFGLESLVSKDPAVGWITVYISHNGGAYFLGAEFANNANLNDWALFDFFGSTATSGAAIATAHPELHQVRVTSIGLGPAGTTTRPLYRTVVGGGQPKRLTTLANNSATGPFDDATADGSLGANAPTINTAGLVASDRPGAAFVTTGVTFATNGAATGATTTTPSFSSASYTFVAADVGAAVFVQSGTNWTPGLYQIVSVTAGAATLDRACASVASPTAATWGVAYSGLAQPRVTFTDLAIDATTATKFTSAAFPVGVNDIGNTVAITGGLGIAIQQVTIVSVSGVIATCDKALGTLSSTGGRGTLGGGASSTVIAPGSTSLPVFSVAPFAAGGGWILAGAQAIRYAAGVAIAPPPGPAPVLSIDAIATGATLATGVYGYAYTLRTALGETLPSAVASIAVTLGQEVDLAILTPALFPGLVTAINLYRTDVNGSQLKLWTLVTGAIFMSGFVTGDPGGLPGFANAPTTDTSGLVSGSVLTGIPASGAGSIAVAIPHNTTVTAAPALTGVSGIGVPLIKGAPVNIWVQRDDLAAQAVLAAADGSDGIVERPPIVDERRNEASLTALCDADLALFSRAIQTVTYASPDVKTKSGKPIAISLTSPAIDATLTIQTVDITAIDVADGVPPIFTVGATTVRHSLENLLRKLLGALAA